MSLVDLLTAKLHLRLEPDYPDEQVAPYLLAAESAAVQFLNRGVFAAADELSQAIAAAPSQVATALAAWSVTVAEAAVLQATDPNGADALRDGADMALRATRSLAAETRAGIVINDSIRAAILLMLGHLFTNREDSTPGTSPAMPLPNGAQWLLQPFRAHMGV